MAAKPKRAQQPTMATRNRRSCVRHRAFATYEAALEHYAAQVRDGRTDPGQVVYRCHGCKQWHHGGSSVRSLGRLIAEGVPL